MAKYIRYIGIDFGTNNTVLCWRLYNTETKEWGQIHTLNEGTSSTIPSLIYVSGNGEPLFGEKVASRISYYKSMGDKGTLYNRFKMDIPSEDEKKRKAAFDASVTFLKYLYDRYKQQPIDALPKEVKPSDIEEQTYVSYPTRWPQFARRLTEEAVSAAGFKNVNIDHKCTEEPYAAFRYLLLHSNEQVSQLEAKGILIHGRPVFVLVVDMGAGTTDVSLIRFVPGDAEDKRNEVLLNYPSPSNDAEAKKWTFGGGDIDNALMDLLKNFLVSDAKEVLSSYAEWSEEPVDKLLQDLLYPLNIRSWKEESVNSVLSDNKTCTTFPSSFHGMLAKKLPPLRLDRTTYAKYCGDGMNRFCHIVNGAVQKAMELKQIPNAEAIDLVVLTGGHSKSWFVRDLLCGKTLPGTSTTIELPKIKREPNRIMQWKIPEETVARGLCTLLESKPFRHRLTHSVWIRVQEKYYEQFKVSNCSGWKCLIDHRASDIILPVKKTATLNFTVENHPKYDNLHFNVEVAVGETLDEAVKKSYLAVVDQSVVANLVVDVMLLGTRWLTDISADYRMDNTILIKEDLSIDWNYELSGYGEHGNGKIELKP
ncbi:hypothetical protein GJ688_07550 [Heliobacillus mobilis]|uniref:Uncharacterized protein n=1 Tax=Heliobacterium mobile TaxID=28064 RepID=A0A6I3SJ81_HELMO|nr:hypothetical protein [Heliobacterium mobile]MTV48835.1 hypothetical protein [Heliobacterium mobile]